MADQVSKCSRILNIAEEFLDSSTEEGEEEEMFVLNNLEKRAIPKTVNYVENVVSQLEDSQFKSHFRVTRATCYKLIEQFERSDCYPTNHKGGSTLIFAEHHILSFLWFAGNKSTIRETGDRFNMSLSTFMSVQEQVVSYFMDILPAVI
ncbi:hypothetical protein FQA39_LY14224 [Lamprigera yunnana]|nr:hypothetical protein FQA39_LY14224 [Lamprigera yunnana]